jgi:Family of unknown function (DUF6624)
MRSDLRDELLRMAEEDQTDRRAQADTGAVDERNVKRLKEIVAQHGWPGRGLVGDEGAEAAWLIVQHSPDRQFMAECLEHLRAAVEAADASPANLAYLEDRVRMFRGERQLYGTQFFEKDGTYVPWPIEDPDGLDERRTAVCLGQFADYERHIRTLR